MRFLAFRRSVFWGTPQTHHPLSVYFDKANLMKHRDTTRFHLKPLAQALAYLFGAMAASGSLAQTAPAATSDPDANKLDKVEVTVQRRLEDNQAVPASVSAIGAKKLADRNITDASQMEGMAAGFTFGRSGTDARPAMRGVRTENVGINGDTTIGYFVDNIYKSRAQQAMAGFIDLNSVEIQRGPQGTLYGRNTFGGNIAVTTRAPRIGVFDLTGNLTIGSYGKARVDGGVNIPINDMLAIRVSGAFEGANGWVKNDFNPAADLFDQKLEYGRVAVKFAPNDRFEATLRMDNTSQRGNGGSAFGYKLLGSYFDLPTCQQLFNTSFVQLNTRGGNRDGVNDCTRTAAAGNGTGANAVGSSIDTGIPILKPDNAYRVNNDYQSFLRLRDTSASLNMAYSFDAFTVKSITGTANFNANRSQDTDFSASTIGIDFQKTKAKTFSQELQLLSNGKGPISYVAGYYFFRDDLQGTFINQQLPRSIVSSAVAAPIPLAQNGAGFFEDSIAQTYSNAFYGQLGYDLTKDLNVSLGARRTSDKKSFKFANANSVLPLTSAGQPDGTQITLDTASPPSSAFGTADTSNCTPARGPGFYCNPANLGVLFGGTYTNQTFTKTTVRAAADYKLSKDNMVYASYANGFRSGGFNSGQAIEGLRTFLPETVKAIEFGSKNRFMNDTVQVNASVFQNNYTNLQEQRQVAVGATTTSVIFNAAKARSRGLEMEFDWLPTKRLTFGGTLSILDAKYTSFPDAPLPFGTSILVTDPTAPATVVGGVTIAPAGQRRVFAPGFNCGLVSGTGGAGQAGAAFACDLSGSSIPYSPKYQGSLSVAYDLFVGDMKFTPLVAVTFSDSFYGQPANVDAVKQSAFAKFDLRLNVQVNKQLGVQLYADNVTDKQTANRFVWGGGGGLQASFAPPRTIGLKLSYKM
jgi:iron complex outermembrane recepter protein